MSTIHIQDDVTRAEPQSSPIQIAELTERIGTLFASPSYRPPVLPTVAIELLDIARYPDLDLRRIAWMIEKDPMLAGQVMRRVNSPIYAGQWTITSLDQAILRLGLNAIRDIVLETALSMQVFTTPGYATTMERVRRHSVATAHIARIIARYTGEDEHEAFLCGLLHDIGIAAALITIDDLFQDGPRPRVGSIWPTVEMIHESAGTLLARIWNLPGDLPRNIGHHHNFEASGEANTTLATIHIAEAIAHRLGRGIIGSHRNGRHQPLADAIPEAIIKAARHTLLLNQHALNGITRDAQEHLDTIR